ncbi:MAG: hypothetical protein JXA74_01630 [Anaerolineae bacterium]|nr:hypothetical protein [Anaerolineae bacterium]
MNVKVPSRLVRQVWWLVVTLALMGLVTMPVLAGEFWTDVPGAVAMVDGVIIMQYTPTGAEPANGFGSFLSLQAASPALLEEGYNTDGTLELDTVEPTRALLLSEMPSVIVFGQEYREIALDLNQLSIVGLTQTVLANLGLGVASAGDLTGLDPDTGTIPGVTPVWSLDYSEDSYVVMDASMGLGEGIPEYLILVPNALFGAAPECAFGGGGCQTYVYLYAFFVFPGGGPEVFGVGAEGPFLVPGNANIHKVTDPAGAEAVFDFVGAYNPELLALTPPRSALPPFQFQIPAGQTGPFMNMLPGLYQVTEQPEDGWTLADIAILDPSGDSLAEGPTASVQISPGETVDVTFENWRLPVVVACKQDTEGDPLEGWTINLEGAGETLDVADVVSDTTGSDGCALFKVEAGSIYTLSEEIQPGWTLISPERNTFSVEVAEPQLYGPYTFVNFQDATITACKVDGQEEPLAGWEINLDGPSGSQSLETPRDGCVTFTVEAPGTYTLTEMLQEGWVQISPEEAFEVTVESGGQYGKYIFVNEGEHAEIDIEKYVSVDNGGSWDDADEAPGPPAAVGEQVVWFRYVISNVGNVTVDDISLSDPTFDSQIAAQCSIASTLKRGESTTCVIGPLEALAGRHENTANVTARWNQTKLMDEDLAHYYGMTSGLLVTKRVQWSDTRPDTSKVFTICIEGPMPDESVYLDVERLVVQTRYCKVVDYDGGTVGWDDLFTGDYLVSEENPGEVWLVDLNPPDGLVTFEPERLGQATIINTYAVSSISDWVWYDANGNGLQDEGERGLEGAKVTLYQQSANGVELAADVMVAEMTTGPDGRYAFTALVPGDYYLVFELPEGYNFSPANVGEDERIDSDADPQTGRTAMIALPPATDDDSWDCGATQVVGAGVELAPPEPWTDPTCAGWKLSWTLAFTNTSPIPLYNVRLTNYHPDTQVDILLDGSSEGAALDEDGHVYWDIEMVGAGERVDRVLQVRLWSSIQAGAVISDCIKVLTAFGESEMVCGDVTVERCVKPTATPTITPSPTATATSTPSPTPTMTPTPSPTPSSTPTSKPGGLYIPLIFR